MTVRLAQSRRLACLYLFSDSPLACVVCRWNCLSVQAKCHQWAQKGRDCWLCRCRAFPFPLLEREREHESENVWGKVGTVDRGEWRLSERAVTDLRPSKMLRLLLPLHHISITVISATLSSSLVGPYISTQHLTLRSLAVQIVISPPLSSTSISTGVFHPAHTSR